MGSFVFILIGKPREITKIGDKLPDTLKVLGLVVKFCIESLGSFVLNLLVSKKLKKTQNKGKLPDELSSVV